jgi:acyl-CoA reductase-like NAD-dependent aldehyde dehydrogenase
VPADHALVAEEAFGPVLTLDRFDSTAEAIHRVNAGKYGIHAGVFTRNTEVADDFYRGLEVGGVIIGDYPTLRFDNMPYGGVKRSGFGREGVRWAMNEMTEPKVRLARG